MARFVVEPAVAVKWFVPESHSSEAARLLTGAHELLGTDQLVPSAGEIITAKGKLGELEAVECREVFNALLTVPISLHPSELLMEAALEIALELECSFKDGQNLALAVQNDCRLVTCNKGLHEAGIRTPFAIHLKWVGDIR